MCIALALSCVKEVVPTGPRVVLRVGHLVDPDEGFCLEFFFESAGRLKAPLMRDGILVNSVTSNVRFNLLLDGRAPAKRVFIGPLRVRIMQP